MTGIVRNSALDANMLGMVPMVIEQSGRGERARDSSAYREVDRASCAK